MNEKTRDSAIKHPHVQPYYAQLLNISFFIIVFAFLAIGCGGGGGGGGDGGNGTPPDTTAPSVPSGVNAIAVSISQIDLSWTASTDVTGVTEYRIYRDETEIARLSAQTLTYSDSTGLIDDTEYCYTITAVDAAENESDRSSPVQCATTFAVTGKLRALDASAGDQFGFSVAISGDYAIVGAQKGDADIADTGAAYIYNKLGPDSWDGGVKITAGDAEDSDRFGWSVAIHGDIAVVGAQFDNEGGNNAGAAYIFQRTGPGNSWDTGTKIMAQVPEENDHFGISVAISNNYIVVGASGDDDINDNSGAVFVFHKTGNTWDTVVTKLKTLESSAGDLFGFSVAISGDYIIAGATLADDTVNSIIDTGAAYIYQLTDSVWDFGTKIMVQGLNQLDLFGNSVAIDGNFAIVGAPNDSDIASTAGAAYVFMRTGADTWDAGVKITASDAAASANFGYSVAISEDFALVGAWGYDSGNLPDIGLAYVFERSGSGNTWGSEKKIFAFDYEESASFGSAFFGNAVAISNDRAIVGAFQESTVDDNAGAAYLFDIPPI